MNDSGRVKKILFILPSLYRAGAETQTINLINGLDSQHFEKYLLTFEQNLDLLISVDQDNVHFYHSVRKGKFDLSVAKEIARIIHKEKIDLVHCTLMISLMMGWLGIRFSQHKPILTLALHTTINAKRQYDWFDKYVYQWLMRSCAKVVFVCKAQEKHWEIKYPFLNGKTKVIYNGVDADYFDPDNNVESGQALRKKLGIEQTDSVLCHIAAFRSEKGHLLLIEAFLSVLVKLPETHLLFAGDGVLKQKIMAKVQQYGIENNVHFLGALTDIRPVLLASDISVLPSDTETFSIAMLESMAMHTPLVATDVGGIAEAVLTGKTGITVPVGDSEKLAEAIVKMLVDDNRQAMSVSCRELIEQRFTHKHMVAESADFFDKLIQ